MALMGIDVHPKFQAGLNIEQVRAEGFDFMAVKLSEATNTYGGTDWLYRGTACGLLSIGYHYLRPGNEVAQAAVFCQQLAAAGNAPGMLDAEALADDNYTATLGIVGVRRFLTECAGRGAHVPLLYLPHWYWERMGMPDLAGMGTLWASGYVNGSGFATSLYEAVTPSKWAGYGNLSVGILQFTDKAMVAGQSIDADAFLGTRDELARLLATKTVIAFPEQPAPASTGFTPMQYGQAGDAVRRLQAWLNSTYPAYSRLPTTGYYGDMTVGVIREFQHRVGILDGDGRNVGGKTIAALRAAGYQG